MKVKIEKSFKGSCRFFPKEIQRIKLEGGYVSDNIEKYLPYFNSLRAVVLSTPMSSGKSTFIEKLCCENPETKEMKLLYVSNRCILDKEIKNRIRNNLGLYPNIDIKGLADIEVFGNVTLLTYQALSGRLNDLEWCNSFDIAVFDECHFFTSDATFNNKCGYILHKIPKVFLNAIRIYMSATVDNVLPYIIDSECNPISKLRWGKRFVSNSKYAKSIGLHYKHNEVINRLVWDERVYASEFPIPLVFEKDADYSYINLKFLYDEADLVKIANDTNGKSLVFVDNKEEGMRLAKLINADFVDADSKNEVSTTDDPNTLDEIIANEKLARNLVSTSVICNGINLKDPDLNKIFVRCDDRDTLIQMFGRKRVEKDEKLTVYVVVPKKSEISCRLSKAKKVLGFINLSKYNHAEFMLRIVHDSDMPDMVNKLTYVHNCRYKFDHMTEEMYRLAEYNYEKTLEMLDDEYSVEYCKFVCEWLGKCFDENMIVKNTKMQTEFLEWLESCVNTELDDEELTKFSQKFHSYAKVVYGSKYKGRGDRVYKYKALNGLFEELGLDFRLSRKDKKYILARLITN